MKKKIWKLLFWVYLALLFLVVILKFRGSFRELIERSAIEPLGQNYNLIPFATLRVQLRYLHATWARFNLMGNTVPFLPFGCLLPIAYRKAGSLGKVLLLGLLFVLLAEAVQFYTNLGSFDVDDILLNMAAIFVGYLPVGIAGILRKSKNKKKKR